MSLSSCAQCKNYSEEVCLLGQSYADVFNSIQAVTDDQDRQRLGTYLAVCAYWEESDLAKLFSHEVTLSYHAWNRLAYMKTQNGDQELFQNLIQAARHVLLHHRQETDPMAGAKAEAVLPPQATPTPAESVNSEPLEEETALAPLEEAIPLPAPTEVAPAAAMTPPTDAPAASLVSMPAPMTLPPTPPTFHPEVIGQPGIPTALNPIEVAMQELWTMATSASNGTHANQPLGNLSDPGRGSGRINPTNH